MVFTLCILFGIKDHDECAVMEGNGLVHVYVIETVKRHDQHGFMDSNFKLHFNEF